MQFNLPATDQGLVQDVLFLTRTTTASYALSDITRNVNNAYHDVTRLIWDSADDWDYDDSNNTTPPKATRTMGHTSATYTIPTTAQRVRRVDVKDNEGNWHKLTPIDERDITIGVDEYLEDSARPLYYDLIGSQIQLFPPPSSAYTTLSSGLCLRVDSDVSEFTTASQTAVPGFAPQFHRILSYAAALDFEEDASRRAFLVRMKERLEKGLTRFYSSRSLEKRPQIRPYGQRRWKQYL
jgi:hypothetical protein